MSAETLSNQMGLTALSGMNPSGAMTQTATGSMATGAATTGSAAAPASGDAAPAGVPGYGVGAAVGALGLLMAL